MRIAIVGAGISGLTAAHVLHREHEVTVYEAGSSPGGHAHTVQHGAHRLDTGFVVFNDRNYPNFTRLLEQLGVATQPARMSFSVKGEEEDFEYSGTPRGVFCQRRNLASARFWRMLLELPRLHRELRKLLLREETGQSLVDFLAEHRFREDFVARLIVPQASAVWSADPRQMGSFPARFLAEFFANHGMLGFRDRPRWSTVVGGSARYVEALTRPFGSRIRLRSPVRSLVRASAHVEICADEGHRERYDHVVIATHSDQALALLGDATEREREILGAIPYQSNDVVLHSDSALLPRRRAARAGWNFHLLREPPARTTITYYMNHLQRLDASEDFCVTLNRTEAIDPAKVIRKFTYAHPVYTHEGIAAQARHAAISGLANRTHYCGAYWGWGFHEDGVVSALRACEPFGVKL